MKDIVYLKVLTTPGFELTIFEVYNLFDTRNQLVGYQGQIEHMESRQKWLVSPVYTYDSCEADIDTYEKFLRAASEQTTEINNDFTRQIFAELNRRIHQEGADNEKFINLPDPH